MKIAVFEPIFLTSRPYAPSYLVLLQNFVRGLARLGNEVIVLVESSGSAKNRGNYMIYPLRGTLTPFSPLFSTAHRLYPSTYSGFFSSDILFKVAKILQKVRPDVIYTCGTSFSALFSALLGRLSGIPSVHYTFEFSASWRWWRGDIDMMKGYKVLLRYLIHQFVSTAPRELFRQDFLHRWGLKNTQLIASSNYVKTSLCNFGLDGKHIPVIYPGIDIPRVDTSEKTNTSTITYLGHLHQNRGVLDLVEAFSYIVKRYPEAKLMVAANNIHRLTEHYFNKLIDKHKLSSNIIRKGVVEDPYLELLAPSTVIALPYRDTPSIKLIESMAAAKPVVTTRIGWTSELIFDGLSGFLVNIGDAKEIAYKVNVLLDKPELASEVGRNARDVIKAKCDLNKNTKALLSILREVKI